MTPSGEHPQRYQRNRPLPRKVFRRRDGKLMVRDPDGRLRRVLDDPVAGQAEWRIECDQSDQSDGCIGHGAEQIEVSSPQCADPSESRNRGSGLPVVREADRGGSNGEAV